MTEQTMEKQEKVLPVFAKRIQELRKERGWSQPELGKKIGTSGKIVGRYELGYTIPSVEVARKFALAFGVTLDSLVNEHDVPDSLNDQAMITRLKNLEELPLEDKERIINFLDVMIRDVKTRETYKAS